MSIRRITVTSEIMTAGRTFPINPINFDNPSAYNANVVNTIDGYPTVFYSSHDGQVRTMEWSNLPNRYPYNAETTDSRWTLMKILNNLPGYTGTIQLKDLSGSAVDTTTQNVIWINLETKFTTGGPNDIGCLKFEFIRLTYALI